MWRMNIPDEHKYLMGRAVRLKHDLDVETDLLTMRTTITAREYALWDILPYISMVQNLSQIVKYSRFLNPIHGWLY